MTTVAVTGAAGYLGRLLVERLADEPDVTRVVGIDILDAPFTTRNLEFYRMDVRSPELVDAFQGCDAVVHLAAASGPDTGEIRDVNVGGTRSVTDAADRAGVRKLVFSSSGSVYGAHPDNDFPLTELSPVRPAHDNAYAMSKQEAESAVSFFADDHPGTVVTIMRLAWVCGPTTPLRPPRPTRSASVVDAKVRFVISGYAPPFQALHEDDAIRALAYAVTHDLPGTYNVCAPDQVDNPDVILGQRRVTLDADRAHRVLDRTSRIGLSAAPQEIATLMYPQVMSADLLAGAGFIAEHSTSEALRAAATARREWVAVGRVRFRRRRVALVAGTAAAVLLGSAAKLSRARRVKKS